MAPRIATESGLGKPRSKTGVSHEESAGLSPLLREVSASAGVPWGGEAGAPYGGARQRSGAEQAERSDALGNTTNKRDHPRSQPCGRTPNMSQSQGIQGAVQSTTRENLRSLLQRVTTIDRIRRCGTRPVEMASQVTVRWSPDQDRWGGSSFSGLQSCESWACPTCAARLSIAHQRDVLAVLTGATEAGKTVTFLTLTMKHRQGQSLERLWDACTDGWRAVTQGRGWKTDQQAYGIEGWIRSTEVTQGKNGWHVHLHVAVIVRESASDREIQALGSSMFGRWQMKLGQLKLTPDDVHGFKIDRAFDAEGIAAYVTKSGQALYGMAAEMALSDTKQAGRSSRTTWQVLGALGAAEASGDVDGYTTELALWHEWEKTQHGRRRLAMSRGLRDKFYAPDDDSAVIEADAESVQDWFHIASLPRDEWKTKFAKNLPLQQFVREELTRAKRLGHARSIWVEIADGMAIDWVPAETDDPLVINPLPLTPEQRRAHAKAEARKLLI